MSEEERSPADAPSPGASQTMGGLENDYYSQDVHGPFDYFSLGAFELAEGETLPDCRIAYTMFGELNDAKDNAVLFPHMYLGTSKDMEMYVGEGMALDPGGYFVILPNQIGNGLSTSPHDIPPSSGSSGVHWESWSGWIASN